MSEARVRTANPWPGRWVVVGGVLLLIGGLSPVHRLFAGIDLEPTRHWMEHWVERSQWLWLWDRIPAYVSEGRYSDAFDEILPVVIGLLACATILIRAKLARRVGRIVVATLHVVLMGGYVAMVVFGAEGGWPNAGDRGERVLHPKAVTFVFSLLLAGMLAAALVRSADLASRALHVVGVVSAVGILWLFLLNPLEFWSIPSLQGLLKVDPRDPPLMVWAWRATVLYALLSLFHARRRMHPASARALLWCGLTVVLLHILGRGLDRPWLLVVREMGLMLGSWFVMAGGIALLLSGPVPRTE